MNFVTRITAITVLIFFLAACSSTSAPDQAPDTSLPTATLEQSSKPGAVPTSDVQYPQQAYPAVDQSAALQPAYPQPGQEPSITTAYPSPYDSNATTGIEEVDRILQAINDADANALREQLAFSTAPCTNAQGAGGPPKCASGESESTPVEGIPVLGPEGLFMRQTELPVDFLVGPYRLIAVYLVKADAAVEPHYPPGKYGLVLMHSKTDGAVSYITLRVDESGIVRVDFDRDMPGGSFPDAGEYLLPLQ